MVKSLLFENYDSQVKYEANERNYTFDLVRGFAVIFMIAVHVLGVYSRADVYNSYFGSVVDFLGSPPAAPVFMFTMGVFFILSSKTETLKSGLIRGVKLLAIAYVFSFIRSDLIEILANYACLYNQVQQSMITFWEVDILQFAGVAYLFMSLIRARVKKPIGWIVIAISIMLISPLLWGITSSVKPIDWILNYIWGIGEETYFPVFNWLFYPLMGMAFGVIYKTTDDHDALFKNIFEPSVLLLAIGSVITITNFEFHIGDYFRSGPGAVIWILGFVGLWIWLNNKYLNKLVVVAKTPYRKILDFICYMGRATTKVYLIHWILLTWSAALFGYETQGYMGTIILIIVFTGVTYYVSKKVKYAI